MEEISFNSIEGYNSHYGLTTRHPLVNVIDLKQSTRGLNNVRITYGVYALFLKKGTQCSLNYGRRSYDYQEGTVVSFAPGQVVEFSRPELEIAPDVVGLMFHPDLIYGTPLGSKIMSYGFFGYSQMEALHLSDSERDIFLDCLKKIDSELNHPVDHHSASVISANIQVLLEYLDRFYDRQFITRHRVNSEVVCRFEQELRDYYSRPGAVTMPGVAYFAHRLNLSPGYFGDLIKKETGSSPKDLITLHIVSLAKQRLATTGDDVSEIAYALGFDYPAHFSRMFKRVTGVSPSRYRVELN
ncbi:MAG: AraC family transcriptional regulator [Bacteroides sp.]|nr:AraC family transcriptional regulator [Bacteroides sp.]MBD5375181.1 AraC family transcriptional regulator [Bacteroides sp.]MDE7461044.1 helix-turn-helix domain-containing protein [Paramuribaculum sp.]